jgi:uncharacterized membrane protein
MVGLGDLSGGVFNSGAWATTPDGGIVVGESVDGSGNRAFRWTSAGGMVPLLTLSGTERAEVGRAVSSDGSVIVGEGSSANGSEAFVWTAATGAVGLDDFAGGSFNSSAYGISADGARIVGRGTSADGGLDAALWEQGTLYRLQDVLVAAGLGPQLTGWRLQTAFAISADGSTIVGSGINPQGQTEAFAATVPEPGGLLGVGALGLLSRRNRLRAPAAQ